MCSVGSKRVQMIPRTSQRANWADQDDQGLASYLLCIVVVFGELLP